MPFYLKPGKHNQSKNPILNSVEDMNNPTEEEVASGNYARQFFKNEGDNIYNADTKLLPKPGADEVIDINNIKSDIESGKVTTAGIAGGKFLTKQLIKEGLKKYAGPMIAKGFGVIGAMLHTTAAYGGQDNSITGEYEKRLNATGENAGDTKKFFDDQYKNFDSQTEFQQRRLKHLNEKYSLGYLQNDL